MYGEDKPFGIKLIGTLTILGSIVGIIVSIVASDKFIYELEYSHRVILFGISVFFYGGDIYLFLCKK
jgi:hypothetical protein